MDINTHLDSNKTGMSHPSKKPTGVASPGEPLTSLATGLILAPRTRLESCFVQLALHPIRRVLVLPTTARPLLHKQAHAILYVGILEHRVHSQAGTLVTVHLQPAWPSLALERPVSRMQVSSSDPP